MNERWHNFFKKLKNPPAWGKAIVFLTAFLAAIGALCMLLVDYEGSLLAVVAYTLFGLAGASLSYSVFLAIPLFPKLKTRTKEWLHSKAFTRRLLENFGFRTVVFAALAFSLNLLFSGFNAYMGIANRSIWYGALATYYIALALLRGGMLSYRSKIGKAVQAEGELTERQKLSEAKAYTNSGIVLLLMNFALSSAIAQMIFSDAHFTYLGWTIFAYAAYAFYKMPMSIVSFIRAQKQTDLTVKAFRNINLTDACVSILALQTALLTMFGDETMNVSLMNTLTGCAVSFISIGLGVYTIVKGRKIIKMQKEKINDERQSVSV